MPVAEPFTTNGVYNGFPSCFEKVDISGFDFWTTASGFNKNSVGSPSAVSIQQSLTMVGKLFWNLHKVDVDTFFDTSILSEQFVTGEENGGEDDAIEPGERVCGGSLSTDEVFPFIEGQIDLRQTSGMVRMYNGATTDEEKFIGYGFGLIDFENGAETTIETSSNDGLVVNSLVQLGGYSTNYTTSETEVYEYVERDGIHFLFFGHAGGAGVATEEVTAATLTAETKNGGATVTKAQITGLEFWTYP